MSDEQRQPWHVEATECFPYAWKVVGHGYSGDNSLSNFYPDRYAALLEAARRNNMEKPS